MTGRVVVADFAGHPFQFELSNELARRGVETLHVYCSSNSTPHADFEDADPRLRVEAIDLGRTFAKYSIPRRTRDEVALGRRLSELLRPDDVVIAANMPIVSLTIAWRRPVARRVLWLQDVQSGLVAGHGGIVRRAAGTFLARLERRLAHRADHCVAISDGFADVLTSWGVPATSIDVIPNWAPLSKLPVRPKDNPWSRSHGLHDRFVFLYNGTLGEKHPRDVLIDLARQHRDDAVIVVASEGPNVEWLANQAASLELDNLVTLPFQAMTDLPDVLGSADVLVALLDPAAGQFSVPSKILSYACAARPTLMLAPPTNAASVLINDEASMGVATADRNRLLEHSLRLRADDDMRRRKGANGRDYADRSFDVADIAQRMASVFGIGVAA